MSLESHRREAPSQIRFAVLTFSDTRDLKSDRGGAFLVESIEAAGQKVVLRSIHQDDAGEIEAAVRAAVATQDTDLVLTTGGTGIAPRDVTYTTLRSILDSEIPGFGELFRWLSYEEIGSSTLQSRCIAGVANGTYIFCLPGSSGACATGWDQLIGPQLDSTNQPCNLVNLVPRLLET